jgi:hypothetical protein
MCAIGKSSFRFFRYNEGHVKPFGFQRGDAHHFLCHAWLGKGDRLIAGTQEGRLMFFERGEYRYDIPVPTDLLKTDESLLMASVTHTLCHITYHKPRTCIVSFHLVPVRSR